MQILKDAPQPCKESLALFSVWEETGAVREKELCGVSLEEPGSGGHSKSDRQ